MGVIADKIRRAIFGGEVRDSIADGIEVVEQLREDYDNQVINAGNSNAEIVDARGNYVKLKERLDKEHGEVISQLETKAQQSDIGDKTQLNTNDKTSIVNAINEVKNKTTDAQKKANNPLQQIPTNSISSSLLKQSNDADKIGLANLKAEVISAMNGTSPTGITPTDGSVTTVKIANGSVTKDKLSIEGRYGLLYSSSPIDVQFVNSQIVIPPNTGIFFEGAEVGQELLQFQIQTHLHLSTIVRLMFLK